MIFIPLHLPLLWFQNDDKFIKEKNEKNTQVHVIDEGGFVASRAEANIFTAQNLKAFLALHSSTLNPNLLVFSHLIICRRSREL